DPEKLIERDLVVLDLQAESGGYVSAIDALKVGEVVVSLGGGRLKASDDIDPCVGYECVAKIGDSVNEGDILGRVSCRSSDQAEQAEAALRQAYSISSSRAESPALIRDSVS
ncbi:MAG: pyrimidine-nucleoside phosphorylase, partial [Acidobacteria bacterium]|nr:pyrimidine-nucleoside phosphorylase [Acidobacteriota bacterium]